MSIVFMPQEKQPKAALLGFPFAPNDAIMSGVSLNVEVLAMIDPSELMQALGLEGPLPDLEQALTHTSFINENPGTKDYQRLEFLGDAVLGLCVSEWLLTQAPKAREGQLTRMRASLVNTEALASFARSVELGKWIRFGRGALSSSDANSAKVLADVVEAIVAAVYLAQGLEGARSLTRRIVGEAMETYSIGRRDPKSELQERIQQGGAEAPTYRVVGMGGPDHARRFEVEVQVDAVVLGRGDGLSKKSAEMAAARAALEALDRKEKP